MGSDAEDFHLVAAVAAARARRRPARHRPVWPGVQPGEPIADELLKPAEVAVLVPMVLLFPLVREEPGRLCAHVRVEPGWSTVELRFGYSNPHDPIH